MYVISLRSSSEICSYIQIYTYIFRCDYLSIDVKFSDKPGVHFISSSPKTSVKCTHFMTQIGSCTHFCSSCNSKKASPTFTHTVK